MPYTKACQPGAGGDCPTANYRPAEPGGLPLRDSPFTYGARVPPGVSTPEQRLVNMGPFDGAGCLNCGDMGQEPGELYVSPEAAELVRSRWVGPAAILAAAVGLLAMKGRRRRRKRAAVSLSR